MNPYPLPTIPMDRRYGGPLDWFDYLDADFRVPVEFFGRPYPKTARQQELWLIKMLKSHSAHQFFGRLLARKGLAFDFQVTKIKKTGWPDSFYTIGTVPLAQLFFLPNENPAEELAQMKGFLTWLDEQIKGQDDDGNDARINLFRAGRSYRGMDAVGFKDKPKQDALTQALQDWRKEPWFDAWYRKSMEHLSRVRLGPHCWFTLSDLRGDREYFRLMAELNKKYQDKEDQANG